MNPLVVQIFVPVERLVVADGDGSDGSLMWNNWEEKIGDIRHHPAPHHFLARRLCLSGRVLIFHISYSTDLNLSPVIPSLWLYLWYYWAPPPPSLFPSRENNSNGTTWSKSHNIAFTKGRWDEVNDREVLCLSCRTVSVSLLGSLLYQILLSSPGLFTFIYCLSLLPAAPHMLPEVFSINFSSKYIFYLSLIRNRWRGDLSFIDCSREEKRREENVSQ